MPLGACAFGRAIDAYGKPLDGGPPLCGRSVALELRLPQPHERDPIAFPLWTGVRAIDALLTIGKGARLGIFGAPGVGKTSLLESIVGTCDADAIVVALVGERGREAQRWIERRDDRTTVICATSDRSAVERLQAANVAFAQAGALRDRGLHVLVVLDSLARVAMALREIAVAAGESAGRGGYPPRVFAQLARLVEFAGSLHGGAITLIATVIHDGDERDPVSEAARSLLDGHISLSPRLAQAGRFPAVDVVASTSRTMEAIVDGYHMRAAATVRAALAALDRIEDARAVGVQPSDPLSLAAIALEQRLDDFLRQGSSASAYPQTCALLGELARQLDSQIGNPTISERPQSAGMIQS